MPDCTHETVEELNRRPIWHGDNPIGTLVIAWCYNCIWSVVDIPLFIMYRLGRPLLYYRTRRNT